MSIIPAATIAIAYLALPAVILAIGKRVNALKVVNPVIFCYAIGLVVGNLGILPEGIAGLQDTLSTVVVALSIPLLLFSVNISGLKKTSVKALVAMGLAALAVAISATIGHLIFGSRVEASNRVAGMMVGLYTGGTPNLAAIKTALDVPSEPYLAVHASDVVLGGLYLLFVVTVGKPLLRHILPPFKAPPETELEPATVPGGSDGQARLVGYLDIFRKPHRLASLAVFGLAVALVGVSLGISMLVPPDWETVVVMLSLSTLAVVASLVPRVRKVPTSFPMAEYLVLVFCLVVGSMANIRTLLETQLVLLGYVAVTMFGSLLIHILLCKLARVDVDTMLVTSTAAICSPPFVGMVGVAIRNRTVISAGIAVGIIGYAVGNYLGVIISLVLGAIG